VKVFSLNAHTISESPLYFERGFSHWEKKQSKTANKSLKAKLQVLPTAKMDTIK
jgi:hypothetical protein